jgi:hypothetical protein
MFAKITAQQIAALPAADLPQFAAIEAKVEACLPFFGASVFGYFNRDESPGGPVFSTRFSELEQKIPMGEFHFMELLEPFPERLESALSHGALFILTGWQVADISQAEDSEMCSSETESPNRPHLKAKAPFATP